MRLTEQQVSYFNTFGFLKFPGLLADQIGEIEAAFEGVWTDHGGGHNGRPHDGTARSCLVPFIDQSERLSRLIDDERIAGIAASLLGEDFNYCSSDGNYYVGDTLWHPDIGSHAYQGIKFAIYCDPLDASNGALRVVPGSHLEPLYSRMARDPLAAFGVQPSEVPAFAFESRPGDVIAFNLALWHAAFGGGRHRRMGTVIFYEDPRTAEATTAVQTSMRGNHGLFARMGRPMYPAYWRAGEHPRRRRTVGRLAELGVLETPAQS